MLYVVFYHASLPICHIYHNKVNHIVEQMTALEFI